MSGGGGRCEGGNHCVEVVGVEATWAFPFVGVSCSECFQFCGEACQLGAQRGLRSTGDVAFGAGLFGGGGLATSLLGGLAC